MKPGRAARRKHRERTALATGTGVVAGLLLLASLCLWLIGGTGGPSRPAAIGGSFDLVQGDGKPVTDRSFRGKYLLIYFGYTSCRDVCPTTLATLAAALDELGEKADRVQPLFITVDPERDTPQVVRRYARSFTPLLIGLTGSPSELRRVADEYRVSGVIHHADADRADYAVDHSSVIYLIGPDGRYIAPIRADETSAAMARTVARYLS